MMLWAIMFVAVFIGSLSTPLAPLGLGLAHIRRGRDGAFLMSPELKDEDAIQLAIGLYALYRTVNFLRFGTEAGRSHDVLKLLRLFAKKGVCTGETAHG